MSLTTHTDNPVAKLAYMSAGARRPVIWQNTHCLMLIIVVVIAVDITQAIGLHNLWES